MGFEDVPPGFDENQNYERNRRSCGCFAAAAIFCLGGLVLATGGAEIIRGFGEIGGTEIAIGAMAMGLGAALFYLRIWSRRNPED